MAIKRVQPTLQLDGGALIPASAGAGKFAVSDASGNISWHTIGTADLPGSVVTDSAGASAPLKDQAGTSLVNVPAWQASTAYPAGYLIQVNQTLYASASAFTSGASFAADGTSWTPLGPAGLDFTHVTPASSYAPDASMPLHWITLSANITLGAATNVKVGSLLTLMFVQDSTGGRTVSWDASYGNSLPRVSPAPWGPTAVPLVNLGTALTPVWANATGAGAGQLYTLGSVAGPALGSGWTQAGAGFVPATFYADANNKVHLSGALTQTAGAAATAWTMPLGYYPKTGTIYIPCMRAGGTAGGYMGITNAGVVQFTPGNTATSWFFDSISFPAGV